MAQLNLHPVAVQMTWFSEQSPDETDWVSALKSFLGVLGKNCMNGGGSLIGHIKGIATVTGSPCLQLSLVSLSQPVIVDGSVPENANELYVTLNVLVFGMTTDDLADALSASCKQALRFWTGSIELEILPAATDYPLAVHGESS